MKQRHLLPILLTWLILVTLLTLHLRDSTLIPSTISEGLNGAKGWKSSLLGDKANDAANAQAWSMENNRMACDYCPHPLSPLDPDLDRDPGTSAFCHSIGEHNLARSIAYEGSSSRIHRLLAKLNSGRSITVGVLGGSVSAGHGLYASGFPAEREGEGNMHWRVFDWVRKRWPVREGEAHRFVNGAVAGTGTDYFSACFAEHIPEDSDLVLMEFAINDMRHTQSQDTYERLLRGVLDLPSKPAVINMHVFGLMFDTIVSGGSEHLAIAQYYDSPVINLRNLALPMILSNASTRHDWFFSKVVDGERVTDLRHLGPYGHQVMANLTTLYLERQLCKMNEMNRLREKGIDLKDATQPFLQWDQLDSLPPQLITASYDPDRPDLPTMSPQCMTTNSEIHPLVQETQEGFTEWAWKEKKYLVGREPGARIKIKFHTVLGTVNLFYQKSASYGLGMVMCWVDDDKDKLIVLDAYWPYTFSIPVQNTVRNDLTQGEHLLTCEILPETSDPTGGHEFRITTLTSL